MNQGQVFSFSSLPVQTPPAHVLQDAVPGKVVSLPHSLGGEALVVGPLKGADVVVLKASANLAEKKHPLFEFVTLNAFAQVSPVGDLAGWYASGDSALYEKWEDVPSGAVIAPATVVDGKDSALQKILPEAYIQIVFEGNLYNISSGVKLCQALNGWVRLVALTPYLTR